MVDFKSDLWDESYERRENFIFYPKDETVKFLNRFVRKRTGVKDFDNRFVPKTNNAIDFGCGIGRQTLLLHEFGFNAYGVDVSKQAIQTANQLKGTMNAQNKIIFSESKSKDLEFENDFFDIGICDSVLDSMEFEMARAFVNEFDRVTTNLFFITLISAECNSNNDEDLIVETQHEKGTVQSYYSVSRIEKLLKGTRWKIKWLNIKKNIARKTSLWMRDIILYWENNSYNIREKLHYEKEENFSDYWNTE